jgi:hypothetical protein
MIYEIICPTKLQKRNKLYRNMIAIDLNHATTTIAAELEVSRTIMTKTRLLQGPVEILGKGLYLLPAIE